MKLAERHLTARKGIREKGGDIRPGTDHDARGVENTLSRINPSGGNTVHGAAPEEMHAKRLFEPSGEARNGFSAFDPKLMRAMQRSKEFRRTEWRRNFAPFQQAAGFAHRACQKFAQNADGLRPPDCHQQAAMMDRDASAWGDFGPKITGPTRAFPGFMRRLASDGDKAEITNAGAIGLRVTIKYRHLEAAPRSMQRMGQAKNARADDQEIKGLIHVIAPKLNNALPILSRLRQGLAETRHKGVEAP
jgi:hypothetical protein